MSLLNEIREHFSFLTTNGVRKIVTDDVDAWTIIQPEFFGVMIKNINEVDVFEKFTNIKIYNETISLENILTPVIILCSDIPATKREFATVCNQFVELGIDNDNRDLIQRNPFDWIEKWKNLLGNTLKKKKVYDVVAELLVVEHLYLQGIKPYWSGSDMGIRDIETDEFILDVKASLQRNETSITISSQYQLVEDKPLFIYFCRMENTKTIGESINSITERLRANNIDTTEMETKLLQMGYHIRSEDRNLRFNILEQKKYEVDEDFPAIVPNSFVGGKIPELILKIQYTVSLNGVRSEDW